MLANATVVIILQYISVSNLHIVLKLTQCCMSVISQLNKIKCSKDVSSSSTRDNSFTSGSLLFMSL